MLSNILTNRRILAGLVFLIGIGGGTLLYNWYVRRSGPIEPVTIYKTIDSKVSKAQKTTASPPTAETTQPSCCESGDALCCKTPGSPCCASSNVSDSTSEQSVQDSTPLSVDTSNVDPIESPSPLLSEERVVPDHIVQEADRFIEWKKKNDALAERRKAHRENFKGIKQEANKRFVDFLMLRPIEARRKSIDSLKSKLRRSGVSDTKISQIEQNLYALGLDFETEVPAEEAQAAISEVIREIGDFMPAARENSEIGAQILKEQKELDAISKDF